MLLINDFKLGILISIACLIYPLGWSDRRLHDICESSYFHIGKCEVKWAYVLAIVQSISSLFLSLLAYVLSTKTDLNLKYKSSFHSILCKSEKRSTKNADKLQVKEGIKITV